MSKTIAAPAPAWGKVDNQAFGARHFEVLEELQLLFFASGYRALTMNMIAQKLRCSKRILYEIAANRKALFLCIVTRWANRIQSLGETAMLELTDPRDKLAAYLEPGVTQSRGMTEAFLEDLRAHPEARRALEQHQRIRMDGLRDIVDDGIRLGHFGEVHAKLVAGICLASIERINDPHFLSDVGLSYSEAFAELYRVLVGGLTPN